MSWTLAPALQQLRTEINTRWPNRSRASDGTIGDKNHQARRSEHNPDRLGIVRAIDVTAAGINVQQLLDATIGDPRVHYVIHNKTIWSRTYGWAPRPYAGYNPHTKHVHISLRNRTSENASPAEVAAAANDTSAWLTAAAPAPKPAPTPQPTSLRLGARGDKVTALQQGLRKVFPAYRHRVSPRGRYIAIDGIFGAHTEAWVKEFQRRSELTVDGIVGPATTKALAGHGIKL